MSNSIFRILTLLILAAGSAQAQLFITQTGETSFFSKTPMENISAVNKKVGSVLNTQTGEIVVRMTMTDFSFPNKLMQEHFNENYVESEKYPYAMFRGKIQPIPDLNKPGTYDVSAVGTFDLHGVKKERTLNGKLTVQGDKITLQSDFQVALVDHKIEVPKLVFAKIAEVIDVKNQFTLTKK
ncbi:YceI family protein [Siphonobacter sp. SORGH_AS_0500]|uniref:YceI family protein n=1 Tax=Siphonobacter sp. SORGH_AS_0500 TaxID=1864824 RepID=UPI002855BE86|nr:YceI family protein [Siphonobacter sp. SORGH_AS_0500]MDR6193925.1 hypothetical protein [Siphonobacter sp. SORGH_AS_0500]